MAIFNDPGLSLPDARQASDQAGATETIVLPAPHPRVESRSFAGSSLRWDGILVLLVFLLAFFLASFPVRSSTFWLHLATGKAYLNGQASFGTEPFTQADAYWVNPSWLFDVLLYVIYPEVLGGAGLVILKALLVVLLGGSILWAGSVGKNLWVAAIAAALSLIALGPWLEVAPVLISIGFLGLLVGLLENTTSRAHRRASVTAGDFGAVLVLTVLWVNLDGWFILAPVVAAIYWLGDLLPGNRQRTPAAPAGIASKAWLVPLAACVAILLACFINPHHFRVLAPAAQQLIAAESGVREDSPAPSHFLPATLTEDLTSPGAGAAYWSLVVLGLLSFVLNRERWSWPRVLLWLGSFFLSSYQVQAVPFFAVVAGIILALNLGEFLEAAADRPVVRFLSKGAPVWQLLGTMVALVVVALAWVGALQGFYGPRRWRVELEPSLKEAAGQIAHWQEQGKLRNQSGFLFSPELANQFAWFSPEEKAIINSHGQFAEEAASDYQALRQGFLGQKKQDGEWRAILRRRNINHVVLYSNNQRLVEAAAALLLQNPREWVPLFWKGRTLVFGWHDPEKTDGLFSAMRLAPTRAAFSFEDSSTAPASGPARDAAAPLWWRAFGQERDYRSPEVDEAAMALTLFDALGPLYKSVRARTWNDTYLAGYVGLAGAVVTPSLSSLVRVGAARDSELPTLYLDGQDLGPRWAPYLAIRAARRALHADPDNPFAYLLLGEAYYRLGSRTQEKAWAKNYRSFGRMRTIQMITAYKQALRLEPNLELPHLRLTEFYASLNFKDYATQHLREYLKTMGPRATAAGDSAAVAAMQKKLLNQQKIISRLTEEYEVNSRNLKVVDRAMLAGHKGLAALALNILLGEDVAAFGTTGMDLELKLLLQTGQIEKVRLWMDEEKEKVLPAYRWNKVQLHAARGDYALADKYLQAMIMMPNLGGKEIPLRTAAGFALGQGLLDTNDSLFFRSPDRIVGGLGGLAPGLDAIFGGREGMFQELMMVSAGLDQEANIAFLRAVLALESGHVVQADGFFREALNFWNSPTAAFLSMPESEYARRIACESLEMLHKANPSAVH